MKFLLALLLLIPVMANANITARQQFLLNAAPAPLATARLGDLVNKTQNLVRVTWDYTVDGGAVGTISPSRGAVLPASAIITRAWFNTLTTLVAGSGTPTIAWNSEGAGDIYAAATYANFTAANFVAGIEDGTTTHSLKMLADRTVKMTIASASVTAGKIDLFIEYVLGQDK